jgi:uncharacterized membrane protein AbrB (regulator of aidB expression)
VTPQELQLLGGVVIGWVVQKFARAPKSIPAWVTWVGIAIAGVGVYIWVTPDVGKVFAENWRAGLAGLITFLLQIRGSASTSSDTRLAPATDSRP